MVSNDSAASGGILVILGIAVALGAVFFYTQYAGHSEPNVTVSIPAVTIKQ